MKLDQIFKQEENIIEEGLRFGSKEKRLVDKETGFRIGIEYEYHVDDDIGNDEDEEAYDEAIFDAAAELQNNYIERTKENYIDEYVSETFNDYNAGPITEHLSNIKRLYNKDYSDFQDFYTIADTAITAFGEWDGGEMDNGNFGFQDESEPKEILKFFKLYEKLSKSLIQINTEAAGIENRDQLENIQYYLPGNGEPISSGFNDFHTNNDMVTEFYEDNNGEFESLKNAFNEKNFDLFPAELLNELKKKIADMVDEVDTHGLETSIDEQQDMLDDIDTLDGDDSDWDTSIKQGLEEQADDNWEEYKEEHLGFDPDDGIDERFHDEARDDIRRSDHGNSKEDVIDELLKDSHNKWDIDYSDIREVTLDGSVHNGVETITLPLKFHDSNKLMKKMFEHIGDVGSTSNTTGMHVNMSIKGLHFKRDNFNVTKLAMLMDEKYLKQETKFPIRNYTESMFESYNTTNLILLADGYAKNKNIENLLRKFEETAVSRTSKYKFINFNNITDSTTTDDQRIEFRFFGGKDYEHKYEEIVQDIYRTSYMMMVAYAEDFGQKEYFNKVIKFLDEKSYINYKKSFFDIVAWIKKNHDGEINDNVDVSFVSNQLKTLNRKKQFKAAKISNKLGNIIR